MKITTTGKKRIQKIKDNRKRLCTSVHFCGVTHLFVCQVFPHLKSKLVILYVSYENKQTNKTLGPGRVFLGKKRYFFLTDKPLWSSQVKKSLSQTFFPFTYLGIHREDWVTNLTVTSFFMLERTINIIKNRYCSETTSKPQIIIP